RGAEQRSAPCLSPRNPMRTPLLFLAHRVPYPLDKGDRIRVYHLLRFLSKRAPLHLACLADEPVEEQARSKLGELCERIAIVEHGPWQRRLGMIASAIRGRSLSEGAFASRELRQVVRQW